VASERGFLHRRAFPKGRKLKCTPTYTPPAGFARQLARGAICHHIIGRCARDGVVLWALTVPRSLRVVDYLDLDLGLLLHPRDL
jgi:hypothetical protein